MGSRNKIAAERRADREDIREARKALADPTPGIPLDELRKKLARPTVDLHAGLRTNADRMQAIIEEKRQLFGKLDELDAELLALVRGGQ